jgi:hypothetical protein
VIEQSRTFRRIAAGDQQISNLPDSTEVP